MKTPMQAALNRAVWTAVLSVLVVGLLSYQHDHDALNAIILAASSAITVLGGRGVVEGNIDSVRAARAANGDLGAVSPADVGAYAPPINSRPPPPLYPPQGSFTNVQGPVTPPQYGSFNVTPSRPANPQGWQTPPQSYRREPEGRLQQPPPVPAAAAHPLDARGI